MLQPTNPEWNFFLRVMHRYNLHFVIADETLIEEGEYSRVKGRDATCPELQMWRTITPPKVQAELTAAYLGTTDLVLDATTTELYSAISKASKILYLSAIDFAVLRGNPPKDFALTTDGALLNLVNLL